MILNARIGRLKLAISLGLVTGFDDINAAIRTTLADVNSEAMYGLHDRTNTSAKIIEHLKAQVDKAELAHQELLSQNESLKQKLNQQQLRADAQDRHEDERRLRGFSDLLEV